MALRLRHVIGVAIAYVAIALFLNRRFGFGLQHTLRMPSLMIVFWVSSQVSAVMRNCRGLALPGPAERLDLFQQRIDKARQNLAKRGLRLQQPETVSATSTSS